MGRKIKVYIDDRPLKSGHAVRGVGSYTKNLIDSLEEQKEIVLVDNAVGADVVHYPYFDLFFATLPLKKTKPTVVTIHDVIPLIYPEYYRPGIRGWLKFKKQKFSLKSAAAVITDSETSKKDIVRFLDIPQDRIYVVHLAAGKEFIKLKRENKKAEIIKKYNLPESFVLYVGDVNYNKNVPGLVRAFARLVNGLKLVLVGEAFRNKQLPETKIILQLIEELGIENKVLTPGFVPPEDLAYLYNLASVYCQPSFYEGFGLPILEAMSCGCPVVAAKTQALVEINEGACLFVEPKNPEAIAQGLSTVLQDNKLKKQLIKGRLQHVKKFSWDNTAKKTLKIYRLAAGMTQ